MTPATLATSRGPEKESVVPPHERSYPISQPRVEAQPPVSYEASRSAWQFIRQSELSATEALVLLALADRFNSKTGRLDPAVSTIAADCRLSSRTVQYALKGLIAAGVVVRRFGGGHHKDTNRYGLMLDGCSTFTRTGATDSPVTATDAPQGRNDCTSRVQDVHPNQEVTKKEPVVVHDAAAQGSVVNFASFKRRGDPDMTRADVAMRAVLADLPWKRSAEPKERNG